MDTEPSDATGPTTTWIEVPEVCVVVRALLEAANDVSRRQLAPQGA